MREATRGSTADRGSPHVGGVDEEINESDVVEYAEAWMMATVEFRRTDLAKALALEYPALASKATRLALRVIERLRREERLTQMPGAVWYWNGPQETS